MGLLARTQVCKPRSWRQMEYIVHTCMYVMHNWNVIVVYAQQRQTLANLTHTHAPELEPRAHGA